MSAQPAPNRNSDGLDAITVVDLFAGVGGLSYGFSRSSGFVVIAANEILHPMAEAYRLNHPDVAMFEGDIKHFGISSLRSTYGRANSKVDLVVGGPPCQAYSTVGKRLLDDPRGALFQEYYRILKELKPRAFIFENVRGLLSMGQGELLATIVALFESLGYRVQYRLLNAACFGAPQIRERVIIVGTKDDLVFEYPRESHRDPGAPVSLAFEDLPVWRTLGDAIGDLPRIEAGQQAFNYETPPQNDFQTLMRRNAPKHLMDHNSPRHNARLIALMNALPEGGSPKDLPNDLRPKSGFPNTYCRLWWDRPSTTVTRNLGTPSSSRCIHPFCARGLTTREGARIQCFPDAYQFFGTRSDRNLQIGNAVPTFLSKTLATQMAKTLS
jgi:DNA (cytosine-5)-methyltransferase 1